MRFDWSTLVLQTVNFAVLAWLLQRFLYKPVLRLIDARRAEIDADYAKAAKARSEAEAKLAALEAERAGIAKEREAALKAAADESDRTAAARRAQSEQDAAAIIDRAHKTIAEERVQALAEARRCALDLGAEIAQRLLSSVPTELRAEAWLDRIERHIASLAPERRGELRDGANGEQGVRVVTAVPLPEPVRTEWRTRLGRALGGDIAMAFDADPGLIAGAELHLPTAVLRFSWRSAMATMRAEIETDGKSR